jgi:hypothetical protein
MIPLDEFSHYCIANCVNDYVLFEYRETVVERVDPVLLIEKQILSFVKEILVLGLHHGVGNNLVPSQRAVFGLGPIIAFVDPDEVRVVVRIDYDLLFTNQVQELVRAHKNVNLDGKARLATAAHVQINFYSQGVEFPAKNFLDRAVWRHFRESDLRDLEFRVVAPHKMHNGYAPVA